MLVSVSTDITPRGHVISFSVLEDNARGEHVRTHRPRGACNNHAAEDTIQGEHARTLNRAGEQVVRGEHYRVQNRAAASIARCGYTNI